MPILLNLCYLIATIFALPILLYRILVQGKYWDTLAQRLGRIEHIPPSDHCIWLHGVSVGEIKAAQAMVQELQKNFPDRELVISVTSRAGREVAKQLYPECTIITFPLDFSWVVKRYLDYFRPDLIILIELELWPNFLYFCGQQKIPVILVNGRLSPRSFRGYSRYLGRWFVKMTKSIRYFSVQSEIYAERFQKLGIPSERIRVTGNIKFDVADQGTGVHRAAMTWQSWGLSEDALLWICGSTHTPEEKWMLECFCQIQGQFPTLRLVLVPRHPQRAEEIGRWVEEKKLLPIYKTKVPANGFQFQPNMVMIVDTMGELKNLYRLATVALVGGSFVHHGGQNFIEPASLGKPVICGPDMHNFPDVRAFLDQSAVIQVITLDELRVSLVQLLQDRKAREQIGKNAQAIVVRSKGSTLRNIALCYPFLEKTENHQNNIAHDK